MTKEEMSEIKYRMKRLARKFCRRNNVYEEFDSSVGRLIEKAYLSAYLLCLHENKTKIAELEAQIEKMKRCFNCKYRNKFVESKCGECEGYSKWEIQEK